MNSSTRAIAHLQTQIRVFENTFDRLAASSRRRSTHVGCRRALRALAGQSATSGLSMASGICPWADSGSARAWPAELPGGGQVFCP